MYLKWEMQLGSRMRWVVYYSQCLGVTVLAVNIGMPLGGPPNVRPNNLVLRNIIIAAEKKTVRRLAKFHETRNEIVHTGVEEMEREELHSHLREIEKLIDEEAFQFDQEDCGNILFEPTENLIDELLPEVSKVAIQQYLCLSDRFRSIAALIYGNALKAYLYQLLHI